MKEQKKQPELRFKGFTDDWEQSKLGNLVEIKDSARISNIYWQEDGIPYLRSSDLVDYTASGALFISKQTYNTFSSKTGSPKKGDVLFTSGGTIGIPTLKKDDSLIYVQGGSILYAKTSNSVKLDGRFLVNYFYNSRIKIYIKNSSVGGTIKHFTLMPAKKMPIIFPKKKEQQKIGEFFRKLDRTITLQQRKRELLKKLKRGYLQQMFPAKDSVNPQLRFNEFNSNWEPYKLGEIAEIVGGGTPSTGVPEYWDGDIDWYSPTEIGESIYVAESLKKITESGLNKSSAKMLPTGTILFTSRAGIGNTAILAKTGSTNQGFQSILPKRNILDSYFIFSRTTELKKYGEITGAGSTFIEVSGKQMAQMPICIPCFEEQKKIGIFFQKLDHGITLQQSKVDKLKNLKQAYLQKLFP
ncbi:restriction endonuclease subunit S [Latilactobacillus sakei]|uniref:restriction endonuclease subunit S n=1 Tax=Latilactobacillus sakei TaxID=1599 RepID=UPI0039B064B9